MDFKAFLLKAVRSRKFLFVLAGLIFVGILPLIVTGEYYVSKVFTLMIIYALYASSWNLLAYSGQGSLGHAAFLGIGSFASALLAIRLGLPPIIGIFVGGLFSAGVGFLIGLACVRLKAWFLAMVTFGFAVIIVTIISQFDEFFGGMIGFATPTIFPQPQFFPFYYVAFATVVVSIGVIYWVMKSKWGLAFKAIHENESEARMIGINTSKFKLLAFVISTFFAGVAGGLYAQTSSFVQVSIFDPAFSFQPLIMSVIGGLATIEGPIIGAAIIVSIDSFGQYAFPYLQVLHPIFPGVSNVGPQLQVLGLGLFLILVVIFLPQGITSLFHRAYDSFSKPSGRGNKALHKIFSNIRKQNNRAMKTEGPR